MTETRDAGLDAGGDADAGIASAPPSETPRADKTTAATADSCRGALRDPELQAGECWAACPAHAARIDCLELAYDLVDARRASSSAAPTTDGGSSEAPTRPASAPPARSFVGPVALWFLDGFAALMMTVLLGLCFAAIHRLTRNITEETKGGERPKAFSHSEGMSATHATATSATSFRFATTDVSSAFTRDNIHLIRALQMVALIPALLLSAAHLYGISSFLLGYSYLNDFARPSLTIIGMIAVGALFGGLFGLPNRSRPSDDAAAAEKRTHAAFGDRLEQVADWLTKLILGASLTQVHLIWDNGSIINDFFARATGMRLDYPLGTVLAIAALVSGFLMGYVTALLFLPVALHAGWRELGRITGQSEEEHEAARVQREAAGAPPPSPPIPPIKPDVVTSPPTAVTVTTTAAPSERPADESVDADSDDGENES